MSFTVSSWNVAGGLGDCERSFAIVEEVEKLDTDLVVLPQAYNTKRPQTGETAKMAVEQFEALGYNATHDLDMLEPTQLNRYGIVLLSRLAGNAALTSLRGTPAVEAHPQDPSTAEDVHFFGVNLWNCSQTQRLQVVEELKTRINPDSFGVVAGTFERGTVVERVLNSSGVLRGSVDAITGNVDTTFNDVGTADRPIWAPLAINPLRSDRIITTDRVRASPLTVHDSVPHLSSNRPISTQLFTGFL